uniref:Uncharacterized protein n=1 Tax=Aegilops tauschii TaxID=37682 RepID=N1QYQ0_AEGTA
MAAPMNGPTQKIHCNHNGHKCTLVVAKFLAWLDGRWEWEQDEIRQRVLLQN